MEVNIVMRQDGGDGRTSIVGVCANQELAESMRQTLTENEGLRVEALSKERWPMYVSRSLYYVQVERVIGA